MTSDRNKYKSLFTPSGCLTLEAMKMFEASLLKGPEKEAVENHLKECDLCSDAQEGLKLIEHPEKLSLIVNELNQNINKTLAKQEVSVISKTRLISDRVIYFAAAASVLILIGVFSYLKYNRPLRTDQITALIPEELTEKIPLTPLPKISNNKATVTNDIKTEMENKNLSEKKSVDNKGNLPKTVIEESEEISSSDKIAISAEPLAFQLKTLSDTGQIAESKVEEVKIADEESLEMAAVDIASAQPVEYFLGEVIIHARNAKINKSAYAIHEDAKKSNVIGGVAVETEKNQPQSLGLISRSAEADGKSNSSDNSLKESNQNADHFFRAVDKMPEFPGGVSAINEFFIKNLHYPSFALEHHIEGTLHISFIVEVTGKISSVNILKGIGGGCDEEAIRSVESMPDWSPGVLNGNPVRVQFNLPVTFKLN